MYHIQKESQENPEQRSLIYRVARVKIRPDFSTEIT